MKSGAFAFILQRFHEYSQLYYRDCTNILFRIYITEITRIFLMSYAYFIKHLLYYDL